MSKILMNKINNILDIDKNKEYINLSLSYDANDINIKFIDMSLFSPIEKMNEFFESGSEMDLIFNNSYQYILDNIKNIESLEKLKEYLATININYERLSNSIDELMQIEKDGKKTKSSSKTNKSKSKKEVKEISNEDKQEIFLYYKKDIYKLIKKELLIQVQSFQTLNKNSKKAFIETGKELLRCASNFINGHINNIYINAPLFLYDIDLEINDNHVHIVKKSKKILNEKLIIFLLKQLSFNYKNFDLNSITSIQEFTTLIEPLLQYKVTKYDESQNNNTYQILKYSDEIYIGLFDIKAGKIKEDFIELMNNNVELLNDKMQNDFEFYTKEEFKNKALIQINNPLNIYQKYAIRSAINENTLIYGPPGTGKSEIITSILANLLMGSKSVLVVSEKDAALDVIKNRLDSLSKFAFYLKDIENEYLFYNQIEQISNHMGSFYNNEYKNENFDISKEYENNDRVLDYNETIKKFRLILQEDIEFSLEKDSRNNDYRDYLLSINEVEEFVKNNKNGVNEFWNEYQNKFVKLQSATEFISKVAQFNWFREKYELGEDETNRYDQTRLELNKFLVENNLVDQKIESFDWLNEKVEKLETFINNQLLNKDKDFMTNLENDYYFLENNYKIWNLIEQNLNNFKEKEYIKRFLLKYVTRHEKFLNKYINISQVLRTNLLNRYYYKGEISTSKMLFKAKKDSNSLDVFLKSIQDFGKIKVFKNNIYLNNLIKENIEIFHPIVIYFYNNKNLLKKSFIEFYNQQIINFDQRIIHQYYKYRVNQIERELININVYNFEKLNKNKHIIERDIPYLITRYLKDNHDFILNIDKALGQTYLKHIKSVLAKSSNDIQNKMENMFKIVRMELKPKINDFINEFIDCLRIIFPIWISKPELISFYLPNEKEIFDVGIFDEASQMFLEKAYPMIYRCKQLIIAGDDKQLKPERILFNEFEEDPDYRPLVKEVEFDLSESLLDRAKVSYWNTYTLRNHYRSQAKELIEFSNLNFYENNLLFSSLNHIHTTPLEIFSNVKNKEQNQCNKEEAKLLLIKLKKEVNNFGKTLVICFTSKQKEYLLELINKEANNDLLTRMKKNLLVIGDISSVQGDEGDLVIISCVFSKESQDYGLLSKPRGCNYLNVAITRAKEKLIVFKSLTSNEVKVDINDPYNDTEIFKRWISYLDNKLKSSKNIDETKMINKINLSTFKKDVYEQLKKEERFKVVNIVQNLIIGSTNIDLAFYTKSINDIDLLIILDDWKKNITIQDWFEDIDCEEYLKSRNYSLIRIREQDWLKDKKLLIEKIYSKLDIQGVKAVNNVNKIKKSKSTKRK